MYSGDIEDSADFEDIHPCKIDRTVDGFISDLKSGVLKTDLGICRMCRFRAVTIRSFFDEGYECSADIVRKLGRIDENRICDDIREALSHDVNYQATGSALDEYLDDLRTTLISLKEVVN